MQLIAHAAEAQNSRRYVEVEEGAAWVQDYFGRKNAVALNGHAPVHGEDFPQAYLVEQQPNQVADPHFHLIDQFQVVVAGGGLFGKKPIAGIAIHYANAYTPYGPIAAGPDGVHYITMRNRWDSTQAHFMPKCRDELKPVPRRHALVDPVRRSELAELAGLSSPATQDLLATEEDGLGIWRYRIPGGQAVDAPDPSKGGGQYWLVLSGALLCDGEVLEPMSCVFLSSDEKPLELAAAPGGVEMLGLQFPVKH
jgi:hypothetical protein